MPQGNVKPKGQNNKKKKNPKSQKKTHREGLVKVAKKAGKNTEQVKKVKMNKKLSGKISNHIEQIMVARIAEDRGQSAPTQLKVLKKDSLYQDEMRKEKEKKTKQHDMSTKKKK